MKLNRETAPPHAVVKRRAVLGAIATGLIGCHYARSPQDGAPEPASLERSASSALQRVSDQTPLVVLVAIDGVRWQDVFDGPMSDGHALSAERENVIPHLVQMERRGIVLGAPTSDGFYASGPNFVSLPGYMEMLSGTSDISCTENDCRKMARPTLLDDFERVSPGGRPRAAAFASWPKVEVAASAGRNGVVSTGRSGGFRHEVLSQLPESQRLFALGKQEEGGEGTFRHDHLTARLARAYLREAKPDFLFVSLGETDERAHQGDFAAYLRALTEADKFVGLLRSDLAEVERSGRQTLLMVTTDHGRASDFSSHGRAHPESSRSFLFAEGSVVGRPGRFCQGRAYLKDIAPTVRAVCGLPARFDAGSGRVLREIVT